MAVIVGFIIVHIALALLVPKTLVGMITGGPKLGMRHKNVPTSEARP